MRIGDCIDFGLRCVAVHRMRTIGFRYRRNEGGRYNSRVHPHKRTKTHSKVPGCRSVPYIDHFWPSLGRFGTSESADRAGQRHRNRPSQPKVESTQYCRSAKTWRVQVCQKGAFARLIGPNVDPPVWDCPAFGETTIESDTQTAQGPLICPKRQATIPQAIIRPGFPGLQDRVLSKCRDAHKY